MSLLVFKSTVIISNWSPLNELQIWGHDGRPLTKTRSVKPLIKLPIGYHFELASPTRVLSIYNVISWFSSHNNIMTLGQKFQQKIVDTYVVTTYITYVVGAYMVSRMGHVNDLSPYYSFVNFSSKTLVQRLRYLLQGCISIEK